MSKMTPRQQAVYALDWNLDPADLEPAVQAEYYLLKQKRLTNSAAGHWFRGRNSWSLTWRNSGSS